MKSGWQLPAASPVSTHAQSLRDCFRARTMLVGSCNIGTLHDVGHQDGIDCLLPASDQLSTIKTQAASMTT